MDQLDGAGDQGAQASGGDGEAPGRPARASRCPGRSGPGTRAVASPLVARPATCSATTSATAQLAAGRFIACGQTRYLHGHHVRHWAQGGATSLDNLVSLCGFHHRQAS